jgi:hypothetical protein
MAFAMWPIIGGYWDSVGLFMSFSSSDLCGSGMRFIVRMSTMIAIASGLGGGTGSAHRGVIFEPLR